MRFDAIATWLGEFYLLATIVLVAAILGMKLSRQPARRLLIARAAFLALGGSILLASAGAVSRLSGSTRENPKILANLETPLRRWPGLCVATSKVVAISPVGCSPLEKPESRALATTEAGGIATRIIPGFLVGSGSILVWLGLGIFASVRLRRRSRPASDALKERLAAVVDEAGRIPEIVVCDGIGQPIAMGLTRPTIVLPSRFVAEEPASRIAVALAHEWGHLRNGDLRLLAISRLLLPILYVHPLYIWLRRRVRIDQELLADARAAGSERVAYAEALLGWAKSGSSRPPIALAPTLGLWERTSQLGERIAVLLDPHFQVEPSPPRRLRLGVAVLTLASFVGLSAVAFRARAEASGSNLPASHAADSPCCVAPPPPPSAFLCPENGQAGGRVNSIGAVAEAIRCVIVSLSSHTIKSREDRIVFLANFTKTNANAFTRSWMATLASMIALGVFASLVPASGQVPPARPEAIPSKKLDANQVVPKDLDDLFEDLNPGRFGFNGGVAERAGRPEVLDLEPAVAQAELILAVRLVDVTETRIVHGGRNEQVTQQFRFEPIRVLKGIYARESLLMTGQDLGIYRFAEGADRLARGQLMLVLLGRQGLGFMNCNGGATLAESIPRIDGIDDPLLGAVGALIAASREQDRAVKVSRLVDGLKNSRGRASGPLLFAIGRRSLLASGTAGTVEAIAPLLKSESPALREVAAKTLGAILDADPSKTDPVIAARAIVAALEAGGPDVAARRAAIEALGSCGSAARKDPAAMAWFKLDQDAPTLAETASRLRGLAKLGVLEPNVARIYGSQPLDAPPEVAEAAGSVLAKFDPTAAAGLISARLAKKDEAGLGIAAEITLLGGLPPPIATPELLRTWNRTLNIQEKLAFASSCTRVADPRLVPALGTLLDPGQYQIRGLAIAALRRIDTDEAASTLWPHLGEEADLASKLRLVAFLGRHGFRDGYAQAIEHLSVPTLREEAVEALAAVHDPRAIPELRRIWETSNDVTWNAAAIRALARLGQAEIAPKLLEIARKPGDPLSSSALIGLGDLGSAEALAIVLEALGSRSDERVIAGTVASSRLLSRPGIDSAEIRTRLAALLADGDASEPVRDAALNALIALNDPGLWPSLGLLIRDAGLEGSLLLVRAERLLSIHAAQVALLDLLKCSLPRGGWRIEYEYRYINYINHSTNC